MLAILTSPQKFWICLLNTEADCRIYFFLVALKNHDILNSQIAFDWHINHLFTSAVTTPIMPPYPVRRTDSSSKSQRQFYRSWMSMSFCWESISFAYFVSFWYAYGMLLPYLSKGRHCHSCANSWGSVLVSKTDHMILKPRNTSYCYMYIPNIFLSFTHKHPFSTSGNLINWGNLLSRVSRNSIMSTSIS